MFSVSNLCSMEWLVKLLRAVFGYIRVVLCIIHNLYCIPIYLLLTLIACPLYWINKPAYSVYENHFYYFCLYIVSGWSYGGGLVVHEHGEDFNSLLDDPKVKILILANHQSMADVPLMMQSFSATSRWVLLWIMDSLFKWTNFGFVSQVHGDFFLNTRHYASGDITKHCLLDWSMLKNAIILFPEGGFRRKRIASSNAYALKRGYRFLNYVTYPRYSGYHELIKEQLGVTHVVDLTICYDDPENTPGIVEIGMANCNTEAHFHYKIFPVADHEEIRTEQWLIDRWTEKEKLLARHYATMRRLKNLGNSNESIKTSQAEHNGNKHNGLAKKTKIKKLMKMDDVTTSDSSDTDDTTLDQEGALVVEPQASSKDVEMNRSGELKSVHAGKQDGDSEAVATFDPRQGRPVRLSWAKLVFVHVFFLSMSCVLWSSVVLLITSISIGQS